MRQPGQAAVTAASAHKARAALAMLAAVGLFALMDAGLKQLIAHYPPFQVAAIARRRIAAVGAGVGAGDGRR